MEGARSTKQSPRKMDLDKRLRSPEESDGNEQKKQKDDILGAIMSMKNELIKNMAETEKRSTDTLTAKIDSLENKLGAKIAELEKEITHLHAENSELRAQNSDFAKKLQSMDRSSRRNNIIFSGIHVVHPGAAKLEVNKILIGADKDLKPVVDTRTITTKKGERKIVATCSSYEDKMAILKAKKTLKGANNENIYVNNDLTPEDSAIQFLARREAAVQRKNGHVVIVHERKIKVDNDWWTYDEQSKRFSLNVTSGEKQQPTGV